MAKINEEEAVSEGKTVTSPDLLEPGLTTYSSANIPYEFQLILRRSRDGFDHKTFWNMCHGHSGTIVHAKVAGTDEIVETNNSFIFSLKNGNIQNSILSRVVDNSKAIFYRDSYDQNFFGSFFGCCEFRMVSGVSDFTKDKECRCNNIYNDIYYEKPIRTTRGLFSIVYYEDTTIPFPSFPVLSSVEQYSSIPVFQYFSIPVSQCSSVVQRSSIPVSSVPVLFSVV
ncbi:hypothetical protein Glove_365g224 [Diversispora epigaea]|uniref:TLDc domain-containing protein n=1 Tax=Diversispora epigaea TaxID=1348612 RepID=A0A397HCS6_9GLOM|nr:hypothetical protein Glove_365g224 [Diversispora epigaea]